MRLLHGSRRSVLPHNMLNESQQINVRRLIWFAADERRERSTKSDHRIRRSRLSGIAMA